MLARVLAVYPPLQSRPSQPRTYWRPPTDDFVKVNFDGAIFSNVNKLGIGVVIRNSNGLVFTSLSQQLSLAYSPEDIKALAASKALHFASEIGCSQVVLDGDSQVLMTRLITDKEVLSTNGLLIADVHRFSSFFNELRSSYTKREDNKIARSLVIYALHILDYIVWMEDVPS